jgi:hypothetical protein
MLFVEFSIFHGFLQSVGGVVDNQGFQGLVVDE